MIENIRKLAKIFQMISPQQYRDLLYSCEDQFFGKVIEVKATKGEAGICLLADLMMTFPPPNTNENVVFRNLLRSDDYPAHMLEIFFGFLVKKMRIFNRSMEGETILTLDKTDIAFAKIPTPDL